MHGFIPLSSEQTEPDENRELASGASVWIEDGFEDGIHISVLNGDKQAWANLTPDEAFTLGRALERAARPFGSMRTRKGV